MRFGSLAVLAGARRDQRESDLLLDPETAAQYAIDRTEGAAEDIADGETSFKTFRDYAEQYRSYYVAARKSGRVHAYRWFSVKSTDDIDFSAVGEYWSLEEHAAGVLVGRHRRGDGSLLAASIPFNSVDWLAGFLAFVEHPDEVEAPVKFGAPLLIVAINGTPVAIKASA